MNLYHDSRNLNYRNPFGALPVGGAVTLSLDVSAPPSDLAVTLRAWNGEQMDLPMEAQEWSDGLRFTVTVNAPGTPGLWWYHFCLSWPGGACYYGPQAGRTGGVGAAVEETPGSYQITVYRPAESPRWYKQAVAYQIFPDRFHRGADWQTRQNAAAHPDGWQGPSRVVDQNWYDTPFYSKDSAGNVSRWQFFGGTLEGIREKLLYLRALGVGVIYLNPIFRAASNHKYDTADYLEIDPGFGDDESFSRLAAEAEKLGIRLILDGVFSHTGADSRYFNRGGNYPEPGAWQEEPSPYDDWYRFDADRKSYECWWGVEDLPNVEETAPSFDRFICGPEGVIRHYLRLGASGWRLDVVDELPDSFIKHIRTAIRAEKSDGVLLGEVWEDASNKVSYSQQREYLMGEELDATMHYPCRVAAMDFLLGKATAGGIAEAMATLQENYPRENFYSCLNLLGTHDTPRILTILGEAPEDLPNDLAREEYRLPPDKRELGLRRLRLAQIMQFTAPGVPCVYYGDEAGMEGYADPFNRGPFPWGREDRGLQYQVRMLGDLRRDYPVLVDGAYVPLAFGDSVYGCRRWNRDEAILTLVNRDQSPQDLTVEAVAPNLLDLLTGTWYHAESGKLHLTLPPLGAVILHQTAKPTRLGVQPLGFGVLLPVSSLPNVYGIGTLGQEALRFVDAIAAAGYKIWQILPMNPVGMGDSPYWSPAVFAGDPRLIDRTSVPDMSGYDRFCKEQAYWLEDYALYTVLAGIYGPVWQDWPQKERDRENLDDLRRTCAAQLERAKREQYVFFTQWDALHRYAKSKGVAIIGDLPIYVAPGGADTWAHRREFQLDGAGKLPLRAGCPPDYFTPEGQDWGNPLYDWAAMEKTGYRWWLERLRTAFHRYDFVRLDHFRSFAAYYAIPAGKSARFGYWLRGAGMPFFRAMAQAFGSLPIVAEDLGELDSEVAVLLAQTGFSGMDVYQFTGDAMRHMPPEYAKTRVFYSGTHDNQTLSGWCKSQGSGETPEEILSWLKTAPAGAVIFPFQDLLGLGDEARINVPGTATGNWKWQMTAKQMKDFEEMVPSLRQEP